MPLFKSKKIGPSKKKTAPKNKPRVKAAEKQKNMRTEETAKSTTPPPALAAGQKQTAYGKVQVQSIAEELQGSYLDYAMSVIVSRALPDVRDGLKPVHRRILYAMWDIGLKHTAKFRKSATVVGEVLGKYHPHGDAAVYDSMVRMAQDFAMRYPLIDGQGNFGSLDGDAPAAMRYTEAKLEKISDELLTDIEKNTVNFTPNYDGNHQEPSVLPARLPNLLLGGSVGIAVGMATNIPPHNLSEVCGAIRHLIENPDATIDDLMEFVKGPDFPTGGIIYNVKDIGQAYATGRGGIVTRAKTEIVETKSGQFMIVVSEIPYQVNKASLVEKIADLVQAKRIEGIKDLRDESDKEGVRIVIELKKDAYPKKVLNKLFNLTQLQNSFHLNMLALVDGIQPKILTLKTILEEHIKHRQTVIRRRTEFELAKAKERAHILEGLMIALNKIDAVIKIIKQSRDRETAKNNLMKSFKLSEKQAIAILEMRLQNLANMERLKIETELKEKKKLIKELMEILGSPEKILDIIKNDLAEIKEKYGDERRTQIIKGGAGEFKTEDLVPNESTVVMITRDGYIKRMPPETFKAQGRGGKGVIGLTTKEEDRVEHLFTTMTHADLLFFTTKGRVFQLKAYDLPIGARTAKGQSIVNFLQLAPGELVSAVRQVDTMEKNEKTNFLVMVTKKGTIKKVALDEFKNVRRSGLIAIKLKGDDHLEWVKPSSGNDEIMLITAWGQAIRFPEKTLRPMGRNAGGVRGIRLKGDDSIVGMAMMEKELSKNGEVVIIMENGFGKRTPIKQYRQQGRGGSGVKTAKVTAKTGQIVSSNIIDPEIMKAEDVIIISEKGQVIRLPFKSVNKLGRATQGVRLMRFKEAGDKVASVAFVAADKE